MTTKDRTWILSSMVCSTMSKNESYLAMYLAGPMQAWGHSSRYGCRTTLDHPTRSGLIGMLMAAMGSPRDDTHTIEVLNSLRFEVLVFSDEKQPIQRWRDYHTVGGGYDQSTERQFVPRKANNASPNTVLTTRDYLADARFGALVAGNRSLLEKCHQSLVDPRWGLWLGRKACIPTDPIAQQVHESRDDALAHLKQLVEKPLFRIVSEVQDFESGTDSIMDVPIDFANRRYSLRRISDDIPPRG